MKKIISLFIFIIGISTSSLAADNFYYVAVSVDNSKNFKITCQANKLCFLALPFNGDYIDMAARFNLYEAKLQFMYQREYLYTTKFSGLVTEIPTHNLPVQSEITLYRKNPRMEPSQDLFQSPVVRIGTPLTSLQVKISDYPL